VLQLTQLSKDYPTPRGALRVLTDVSLELKPGDAAAVTGPSGSGKSSLLYIVGGLEPPSSGTVTLDGDNPFQLSATALAAFRNRRIGFVFQDHCLLPQCTVLENVLIPTLVAKSPGDEARAKEVLGQVGLSRRLEHLPAELSGGEKQRVAIARALIRGPKLLLCDEPTGNLDRTTAASVADLLLGINQSLKTILIVVTHSSELAARFPKRFELIEGSLQAL
jgi:lipoprotein-releasing system ATP-binding protein